MFIRRDDGLDRVFIPFHLGGMLLAAILTAGSRSAGPVLIPLFLGWYAAGFLALMVLFYLVVLLYSLTLDTTEPPREDHPRVRRAVHFIIGHLNRFARIRIHFTGGEKLPQGRFLLVSNHRSGYDPISTVWALRKEGIAFITKPENHRIPLAGPMIFRANYLPIDRENPREAMKTVRAAAELIRNDVISVGVYPEGTRGHEAEMLPFHSGVFKIAQRAAAPLVVLSTQGTENLTKNFPWRHTDVYLDVLAVIPPEEHKHLPASEVSARVREILEEALAPLGTKA